MTMLAGIIHLWVIPDHWAHAPAHGLFFLLVGIIQIVWGIAVWRRPSTRLYYIGVIMAGWLIVLYGITRWLPAPFDHGPEAIRTIDVACKLCEGLAMISLAVLIFQGLLLSSGRMIAQRVTILIVVLSIIAGFFTYGIARAAEPIFPSLSAPAGEHHHDEGMSSQDHYHDEVTPTTEHHH